VTYEKAMTKETEKYEQPYRSRPLAKREGVHKDEAREEDAQELPGRHDGRKRQRPERPNRERDQKLAEGGGLRDDASMVSAFEIC
jgi:hypothetical protein